MATTGTIYGTTINQYIDAKIDYSYTQDINANTSTVTVVLKYRRNNTGYTTSGTGTFHIGIGNESTTISKYMNIGTGWAEAGSVTKTISHNADGTKSILISAAGGIPGTTLTASTCSGTVPLKAIPRASTITTIANKSLGNSCIVAWTPLSSTYRYKLQFSLKGWLHTTDVIHPNQITTYNYILNPLPLEVANQFSADSKEGTLEVRLFTYSDSAATTKVGSTSKKTFTVTLPDNASTKPTVTMSFAPVHSLSSKFASVYVQGKSKVQANLSAEGKYGASIDESSYKMSALGKTDSSSPYQSDYLTTAGTVEVTGYATDSRGFTGTKKQSITVIPYSRPKIIPASGESSIICARCDANGNLSESGTYLKIKAKRSYSKVESGTQLNFCSIRYRYKKEGGSYSQWATILEKNSLSSDEIETGALLEGALLATNTYIVQLGVVDEIGEEDTTVIIIPTDKIYMDKAGSLNSLGIGKYAEDENTVDIAEDLDLKVRGAMPGIEIAGFADLNDLKKPNKYYGRYSYTPYYLNCPIKEEATFSLEVLPLGPDGQTLQRITLCSAEATVYERQYYSNTWNEWECVNPPMREGVEYRTKERYLGKTVYTKLINFGALPNATKKTVQHGAASSKVIRCVGQMSDGNSIPFHYTSTNWVEIYAGPQLVVILTGDNKSTMTAYAQIWYIKD